MVDVLAKEVHYICDLLGLSLRRHEMHIEDDNYLLINNIIKRWKRPICEESREDREDSIATHRSRKERKSLKEAD